MPSESVTERRNRKPVGDREKPSRPGNARLTPLVLEDRIAPAITGLVFHDHNANGFLDTTTTVVNNGAGSIPTAIDHGLPGVTITAFDVSGAAVASAVSGPDGTFTLATTPGQYRVEFTNFPEGYVPGPQGLTNRTAVQFVSDGATNANFGMVRPTEFFRNNPLLLTNVYATGEQYRSLAAGATLGAPATTSLVLQSFPYSAGSVFQDGNFGPDQPTTRAIAVPASELGTTWGLAFDRAEKRILASAYTKRHAGWGPEGIGAIYSVGIPTAANPTITTATPWLTLPASAVAPTGAGSLVALRAAYTSNDDYLRDGDNVGWDAIGKIGLGGLDISADGSTVYVMNLFTRSLMVIPVNADGSANVAGMQSFLVPLPANATGVTAGNPLGDVRPFAVQVHEGQVYIGLVNSAESATGTLTERREALRAYVYAFNPNTGTWGASLLNEGVGSPGVRLDYSRGSSYAGVDDFLPWSPVYARVSPETSEFTPSTYPQPMLSGLAFDAQGNLVLGLRDRHGDQTGRFLPSEPGSSATRQGISTGDMLRATGNPSTGWILESAGNGGPGGTNGQGPGGGEFFYEDNHSNFPTQPDNTGVGHNDVTTGGVLQISGFPSVVTTAYNPLTSGPIRSGGIRWFDTASGELQKSFLLYGQDEGATFGKAAGLGDLIAVEAEDPPVEIGDRIFRDDNLNGIQDANELGIGGLTVELWWAGPNGIFGDSDDAVIATAITNSTAPVGGNDTRGTFYFNSGPIPAGLSAQPHRAYNVPNLTANGQYQIRIPNATGVAQQSPLTNLILTRLNADPSANGSARDSDGVTVGSTVVLGGISGITLPGIGASDHSWDVGFGPGLFLGDFVWEDLNNNGLREAGEPGIDGLTVRLYQTSNLTVPLATTKTVVGAYQFSDLMPGEYVVEVVAPPGFRSSSGTKFDPLIGPFESSLVSNSPVNDTDHGVTVGGSVPAGVIVRTLPVTLYDPTGPNAAKNGQSVNGIPNNANLVQDFGFYRVFSIGNRVWLDWNNSGTLDAADGLSPGIDGVTLKLYLPTAFDASGNLLAGATPVIAPVQSAKGGYYRFDDVPTGQYVVVVDGGSAALAGMRSSTGGTLATTLFEPDPAAIPPAGTQDKNDNGTTIAQGFVRTGVISIGPGSNAPTGETDLVSGANPQGGPDNQGDMTIDFGFFTPLSLGNRVFEDRANTGRWDAGDVGIDGVTVRLFLADPQTGLPLGAALETQVTKNGGYYLFTGLGAGNYLVEIDGKTLPAGGNWRSSSGVNGSLVGPFESPIGPINPNTNKTDDDDNGTVFQNDAAVYLIRSGVVVLSPGTASLGEPTTPGWVDLATDADGYLALDFGFWRPLALGNFLWDDANNNGMFDTGETGLPGVTVYLFQDNGDGVFNVSTDSLIATTTSGTSPADLGYYQFGNLAMGSYFIVVVAPSGYISSTGKVGSATGPSQPVVGLPGELRDHGTQSGSLIRSNLITLAAGKAPTGEAPTPGQTDTPPDADANLTIDFGLFRPLQIGNLVWNDLNNNGVRDTGEGPLANLAVQLLNANGELIATTKTNSAGNYLFDYLIPGEYRVRVTPPAGFRSSTGTVGSLAGPFEPGSTGTGNNEDRGTQIGNVVESSLITLAVPGQPGNPDPAGNLRQDFGLFVPLSLGNFLWEDANNNGKFDTGELPLAGVAVDLLNDKGVVIASTTSNAQGEYLFGQLIPGNYTVRVTTPTGYVSSSGKIGSLTGPFEPGVTGTQNNQDHGTTQGKFTVAAVTLLSPGAATNPDTVTIAGDANLRQDFGFFRPITLGDLIWNDLNNNGTRDAGEPGLAGVFVQLLDASGALIAQTKTDAQGEYRFENLTQGAYTLQVTPPSGFRSSTGTVGSATGPIEPGNTGTTNNTDRGTQTNGFVQAQVTLTRDSNPDGQGFANLRQDFGLFQPLAIGNLIWDDLNNDGQWQPGEPGLVGIPVRLLDADGQVIASTVSGANGAYRFDALIPGDYRIQITPPAGYISSTGTGNGGPLTGPFEPGVTSDVNNVDHGTQVGAFVQTALVSLVASGNPDGNGLANLRQDLGLFQPLTLGNTVWNDANKNGIRDSGEAPISGVTVRLLDANSTPILSTTTDASGQYQFANILAGKYFLEVTPPEGLIASAVVASPINTQDDVNVGGQVGPVIRTEAFTLVAGQAPLVGGNTNANSFVTADFGLRAGEVPPPPPPGTPARVSGFVYLDPDVNGIFTPGQNGDRPLPGVTVTLSGVETGGAAVPPRSIRTDANGFYEFSNLPPGTYTLVQTQPGGIFYDGIASVGNLGGNIPARNTLGLTLQSGDAGTGYNFAEIPATDVYGYVWVDQNGNALRNPGEAGVAGVAVTISGTAFAGTSLARPLTSADVPGGLTQLTGPTGLYQFLTLPPGEYTLRRESLPANLAASFTNWAVQQGDPGVPAPIPGSNQFTAVVTSPTHPIRGPLNFGVVSTRPGLPPVPAPGGPTRAEVNLTPAFTTTTGATASPVFQVVAAGAGYAPIVRVFDYTSGVERFRFLAYEDTFTGGVRVTVADFNGDGTPDIITATGVGGGPRIRVFSGVDGGILQEFFAYEPNFRGGVFVAAGDVNGDGRADIITGTEVGGGPRVTVFNAANGAVLHNFFAFDVDQRGGVRVAAADFDGDGQADLLTTTGNGVPTRVRVFRGTDLALLTDYAPYEESFTGGVSIAAGDFNGDGSADVIVGAEAGGGPRVQIFNGLTTDTLANFYAYEDTFTGGVRVASTDIDSDGRDDLATVPGPGGSSRVRILRSLDLGVLDEYTAFDPDFVGGAYVG